jgi:hypothetical protein
VASFDTLTLTLKRSHETGKEAEFFHDEINPNRTYLANVKEIQSDLGVIALHYPGNELRTLTATPDLLFDQDNADREAASAVHSAQG